MSNKTFVVGCFEEEDKLFNAISSLQKASHKIHDVYTPYPIHGLDEKLNYRQTKLHTAGFIFGAIGLTLALTFMSWVFVKDWPLNFGGKPFFSLPAFVPILFEFTVLMSSVGMVLTFCYISQIAPFVKKHHFHIRATDDLLVVAVESTDENETSKIKAVFEKMASVDTKVQSVENTGWWFGLYNKNKKLFEK